MFDYLNRIVRREDTRCVRLVERLATDLAPMYAVSERNVSRAQDRKEIVWRESLDRMRKDRRAVRRLACCLPGIPLTGPGIGSREETTGCLEQ